MWMARRPSCVVIAAAALFGIGDCGAQDRQGYFGFGIGRSEAQFDSAAVGGSGTVRTTSGGIYAGYDFTPHFGIQSGSWWLASEDLPPVAVGNTVYTNANRDVYGITVQGTATWPITERFGLIGKLGMFFWQAGTTVPTTLITSDTLRWDSGVSLTYGVGARIHVGARWGLRFDYDAFEDVDQSRMQMLTAGAYWRF
jgi:hypothetical protein